MAVEVATIKQMQDLQRELAALRAELTQQADCAPVIIPLPKAGRWEHVFKGNQKRVKFRLFNLVRPTAQPIVVPNPAAGADWVQTVPAGQRWRVMTGNFTLTTSAVVANRFPAIIFDDGVNQFYATAWDNAIAANTAPRISLGPQRYVALNDGNSQSMAYIGNLVIPAGARVRSVTTSMQAGDQWSAITLLIENLNLGDIYWSNKAESAAPTLAGPGVPIFGLQVDPTDPYADSLPWVYGGDVFAAGTQDTMQLLAMEWTRP